MVISPPGFLMTDDAEDFAAFAHLADDLIVKASKDQLADVARLLALNIGYYQEKYGDVPQEELLRLVRAEDLDERTKRLLRHGRTETRLSSQEYRSAYKASPPRN